MSYEKENGLGNSITRITILSRSILTFVFYQKEGLAAAKKN